MSGDGTDSFDPDKGKTSFYRFVVADSRAPRDGRFIEILGHYNPIANPTEIVVDKEKALYWLEPGCATVGTRERLFKKAGIFGTEAVE